MNIYWQYDLAFWPEYLQSLSMDELNDRRCGRMFHVVFVRTEAARAYWECAVVEPLLFTAAHISPLGDIIKASRAADHYYATLRLILSRWR